MTSAACSKSGMCLEQSGPKSVEIFDGRLMDFQFRSHHRYFSEAFVTREAYQHQIGGCFGVKPAPPSSLTASSSSSSLHDLLTFHLWLSKLLSRRTLFLLIAASAVNSASADATAFSDASTKVTRTARLIATSSPAASSSSRPSGPIVVDPPSLVTRDFQPLDSVVRADTNHLQECQTSDAPKKKHPPHVVRRSALPDLVPSTFLSSASKNCGSGQPSLSAFATPENPAAPHRQTASSSSASVVPSSLFSLPRDVNPFPLLMRGSDAVLVVVVTTGCLCVFGILHLVKLANQVRQRCQCKLCRNEYHIVKQLGSGGFGSVYLAQRRRGPYYDRGAGSRSAAAALPVVVLKKICVDDVTENDSWALEGRRLSALSHPFMAQYHDDFLHQEFEFGRGFVVHSPRCFCVVCMEYYSGGDLKRVIEEEWETLVESRIRLWIYQIASALAFLHGKGILHRDVKSANIFLAEDGTARLGDLGLSRFLPSSTLSDTMGQQQQQQRDGMFLRRSKSRRRRRQRRRPDDARDADVTGSLSDKDDLAMSQAGTACYMAPEMAEGGHYGKPSDVWGLGCVLLELCSGRFMWQIDCADFVDSSRASSMSSTQRYDLAIDDTSQTTLALAVRHDGRVAEKLVTTLVPSGISQRLKRILTQMLHYDPSRRLTLAHILKKKWFRNPVTPSWKGGHRSGRYHHHRGSGGISTELTLGEMRRRDEQRHAPQPSSSAIATAPAGSMAAQQEVDGVVSSQKNT